MLVFLQASVIKKVLLTSKFLCRLENDLMTRMNLREAADRTMRSVTTLRRYLRSGRLKAEKTYGRYGPEYFVTEQDLQAAELLFENGQEKTASEALTANTEPALPAGPAVDTIPLTLFQELQMKHEQLLVQYGMVRAGGMRVMELQADLESRNQEIVTLKQDVAVLKSRLQDSSTPFVRRIHEAELELKGRQLEIDALTEKVRGLEMLTRNSATNRSIESQFSDLLDQEYRVEKHAGRSGH
jgi:hypothetical protein